jgi:hypothetical protein
VPYCPRGGGRHELQRACPKAEALRRRLVPERAVSLMVAFVPGGDTDWLQDNLR